jgi:hypothetical protein
MKPRKSDRIAAMRAMVFLLLLAAVTGPAVAAPQRIGIFYGWGAFADPGARKCHAIARPFNLGPQAGRHAYASVGYWPGRAAGGQFHVRLSREKRAGSAVILRLGDQSFPLMASATDAWATDARADAEILAALRRAAGMRVESRARDGSAIRDRYALRGAATAIDAAAIACLTR